MNHHHVVGRDGIAVNLDGVGSILLSIGFADGVGRQFARLAQRHETGAQLVSQNRATDKAASFDTHHLGHTKMCVFFLDVFGDNGNSFGVLEGSSKVAEHDTLSREIRNGSDKAFHLFNFLFVHCLVFMLVFMFHVKQF